MKWITKHKNTDNVLFESDEETFIEHIEKAVSQNANLWCADLRNANLRGADLRDIDLWCANLKNSNLRNANLRGADLRDIDLRNANLRNANLRGADLRNIDLRGADLRGADLRGADLRGAVTVIQGLQWVVYITNGHIRIGCESHLLTEWENFSDEEIHDIDSEALEFWKEYKDFLINECRKITK